MKTFIDPEIVSVELQTIKRGSHKVFVNWNTQQTSSITFSSKKDAQYYYDWITCSPKHPLHKLNKEFGL